MRTIDMHTHLPGKAFGTGQMLTSDFLALLDRARIDQAVVTTVDGFFFDYVAANNVLAGQTAEADHRLIPFCTVDPYSDGAVAEVRRCIQVLGFRGIKLHPPLQGFSPLGEYVQPIAAEAARLKVPILFHDGTPPYSTPLQIGYLADRMQDLTVILGHGGRWDLWIEAVAAVKRYRNCYVCLSGAEPLGVFARIVEELDSDRIMIGTDAGWTHDAYLPVFRMAQFRELASRWSKEKREAIFWRNAARLLGLEQSYSIGASGVV